MGGIGVLSAGGSPTYLQYGDWGGGELGEEKRGTRPRAERADASPPPPNLPHPLVPPLSCLSTTKKEAGVNTKKEGKGGWI